MNNFNKSKCDTLYHISCATDINCADDCNMKCPEVKQLCEEICNQLHDYQPLFTRELFNDILNQGSITPD